MFQLKKVPSDRGWLVGSAWLTMTIVSQWSRPRVGLDGRVVHFLNTNVTVDSAESRLHVRLGDESRSGQ